jgi:hypothetical protein
MVTAMPDRLPGLDTTSGPMVTSTPGRPHQPESPLQSQEGSVDRSVPPGRTLTYDQIDPARLVIGDSTGRLDDHLGVLGVALAQWMARDDTRPQPEVRQAANTAMDAIDAMLAELHQLRASLIGEIRQSDDLAAARADELLDRLRQETP